MTFDEVTKKLLILDDNLKAVGMRVQGDYSLDIRQMKEDTEVKHITIKVSLLPE